MVGFGFSEILIVLMLFGSQVGMPLGMPPGPDVPHLAAIAPETCLFYASWNGQAAVDPQANPTERWLGREPIEKAAAKMRQSFFAFVRQQARAEGPHEELLAETLCELGEYALTHATAVYLADGADWADRHAGSAMQCSPEFAAQAQGMFERLHSQLPADWLPAEFEVDGKTFRRLTVPSDPMPLEFSYGIADGFAYVGWGNQPIERMRAAAEKEPPAWHRDLTQHFPLARRSTVSFVHVRRLVELGRAAIPAAPQVAEGMDEFPPGLFDEYSMLRSLLDQSGIAAVEAIQAVSGLDEHGYVCRQRIQLHRPLDGWLALFDAPVLTDHQLQAIPGKVDIGVSLRISFDALLEFVESQAAAAGESLDEPLDQFRQTIGVDLRTDILAALDGSLSISSPFDVANPIEGLLVQIGVADEMAFSDTLARFNRGMEQWLEGMDGFAMTRHDVEGVEVVQVEVSNGFFAMAPTWCLTDGRVLVGFGLESISALIRQPRAERLVVSDSNLARLLAEVRTASGGNPCGVTYQNTAQIARELMGMVSMFDQPEAPFNVNDLPSTAALCEGLEPAVLAWYRTSDGFEVAQRQTLPSAPPAVTLAAAALGSAPAIYGSAARARLAASQNNMKQLIIGLHNYHDAFEALPAAHSVDPQGKPLLSWRVHILPFLGHTHLYDQFHLDEPWDSPHNKDLIAQMPLEFKHPQLQLPEGTTVYQAVTGDRGMLQPQKKGDRRIVSRTLESVSNLDGVSNTVLLVETPAEAAVVWTQPSDFEVEKEGLVERLRGVWKGRIVLGIGDGAIRIVSSEIGEEQMRSLLTVDDGAAVDWEALGK